MHCVHEDGDGEHDDHHPGHRPGHHNHHHQHNLIKITLIILQVDLLPLQCILHQISSDSICTRERPRNRNDEDPLVGRPTQLIYISDIYL